MLDVRNKHVSPSSLKGGVVLSLSLSLCDRRMMGVTNKYTTLDQFGKICDFWPE